MNNLPRPPAHVEPYVRILGVEGAVTFLMHFGGGQLYLPRMAVAGSTVALVMGEEKARDLGAAADRLPRRVPTAKPWLAAVMQAQGLSVDEIARRLHASNVAVRGWLQRDPATGRDQGPRQLRLF